MKRTFLYSLLAAATALVSCTQTTLDPLKGIYPPAQEPAITLSESSSSKQETTRVFALRFTGDATLDAYLVGARNQYYLEPNVYGPGTSNGCFLVGDTKINGKSVVSGNITVQKYEGDLYKLVFVLFDSEGTPYRTKWEGDIFFAPDPEPVVLTEVLIAQNNGNGTVTVKLGTAGMSVDMMGTPTGDGFALTADLYSPDGYLHEGTYGPAAGEAVGEGEYAPGYEYDLSDWGMGIMHWGTCWWSGENVKHITSGNITVAKSGADWVITWGDESTYPDWAVFTGAIEALTPAGGGGDSYDGVTLTQILGTTDYTGYGIRMVGIDLGTAGITVTPGDWGNVYGGEGNYLKLELYSADGKIAPGTYKACAEGGVIAEGEFGIGYDGMFGASGTTWYTMTGGEATYQYITDGTVVVEADGDSYKISIESSVINARYGYGEGGGGGDSFDGTVLTQFLGASDYTGYGISLAGVDLGTAGITVTPGDWGNTYGGDGNYLKLEFYSTDGKLAPGEYSPCATGGEVGEGEFGIGYDGMFGASGTTWYTLTDGVINGQYVTDGKLTVEADGDVYTITLTSSVINAQYKGKFSAE